MWLYGIIFPVLEFFSVLVFIFFLILSLRRYRDNAYTLEKKRVKLIYPCRGVDFNFDSNIKSLLSQNYDNYDIVGVVDDRKDPAFDHLTRNGIRVVVSDFDCETCSGKVKAIATILEKENDADLYAVADSDATVRPEWLSLLVAPFSDPSVGVTTTFPVFKPAGGFWSVVKSVWGTVGMGMMQSDLTRFVWGGSMVFRKELIDAKSLSFLKDQVSDDVAIMRISKERKYRVEFVRSASPTIYSPEDFHTFFEWANRQTALTVSAAPEALKYGIIFYSLNLYLLISSIIFTLLASPFFLLLLLPFVLSGIKNSILISRRKIAVFAVTFMLPALYIINLIISSKMRSITWRGRKYKLYP